MRPPTKLEDLHNRAINAGPHDMPGVVRDLLDHLIARESGEMPRWFDRPSGAGPVTRAVVPLEAVCRELHDEDSWTVEDEDGKPLAPYEAIKLTMRDVDDNIRTLEPFGPSEPSQQPSGEAHSWQFGSPFQQLLEDRDAAIARAEKAENLYRATFRECGDALNEAHRWQARAIAAEAKVEEQRRQLVQLSDARFVGAPARGSRGQT